MKFHLIEPEKEEPGFIHAFAVLVSIHTAEKLFTNLSVKIVQLGNFVGVKVVNAVMTNMVLKVKLVNTKCSFMKNFVTSFLLAFSNFILLEFHSSSSIGLGTRAFGS